MELWSAFWLGFVGSLHCAGMCGPLVLALPIPQNTRLSFVSGRFMYNVGRVATYSLIGALFGLIGEIVAVAGFQRWLSLAAGATLLIGWAASSRIAFNQPIWKVLRWLKSEFASLLSRRTLAAMFGLGAINGLLPCGLVYVASTASIASGKVIGSVQYMLVFGLATWPMMFGIGLVGSKLQAAIRLRLQRLVPLTILCLGGLLILRGLSLGIPFLSPDLSNGAKCPHCLVDAGSLGR